MAKDNDNGVVQSLLKVLANTYGLYLKTQNYHWNVVGPRFLSLHAMFEAQYQDLFNAMDLIAERIRALSHPVPHHQELADSYMEISETIPEQDDQGMLKDLAKENELLIKLLNEACRTASKAGDRGSEDITISRLRAHEKALWMLRATLL